MTQAMLLNWAVGRAQAAARAADSGVGSPRSPPPVSIQRGAAWGGAGWDARVRAGIRRTKYRRVPAIFSGASGARARRTKGRPDSARRAGCRVAILYSARPCLVPGNVGPRVGGWKGGASEARFLGRACPPGLARYSPSARPDSASLWARSCHRACPAGPDSRGGGAACGHHFLRAGDTHPGRHGGVEAAVAARGSACTCIMGAAAAAPILCAFFPLLSNCFVN